MAQRCTETTNAGEPCKAWAVNGGTQCAGHAGLGIVADPHAYAADGARAKAANARDRAEKRKETLLDRIARQTEERAAEIVAAYFAAGARGDWRALEALVTRVHGKPIERVAVEAPADPLGVASMSAEERAVLLAQVLEQHPHLAALTARTPRVPGAPQPLQ